MRRPAFLPLPPARAFLHAEGANAAVEFAFVLPVLLLLLFGAIDLTEGVTARRKLALAASTVSDLTARVQQVDGPYANNVFQASAAIMAPYDASRLTTVVSSVVVDNNGKATVAWSLGKNAAAHAKGSSFPLASGLKVPNSSLIVSEVSYDYKPVVGYVFGELQLTDTSSVPPRVTGQGNGIACTAPGC